MPGFNSLLWQLPAGALLLGSLLPGVVNSQTVVASQAVAAASQAAASSQTTLTPASLFPLQQNAGSTGLFPMPRCGSFKLEEATIDQMQAAMASGTLTSVQLVQCYMLREFQTHQYIK
jgi:amidase